MADITAGGGGSFATTQDNQGFAKRCGQNCPIDAKGEISASPAPATALREKLRQIRDSDHPASKWARNVVQIMDDMKNNPDDPDLLRALGKAVAMLERVMADNHRVTDTILTASEVASIFGLGGDNGTHQ